MVFSSKLETLPFASKGPEVSSWRFLRTGAQERFYAPSQGPWNKEPLNELGAKRPLQLLGQKRVWLEAVMEVAL